MTTIAVIPARWASTRFPGKPLANIAGKPMIEHVIGQTRQAASIDDVVVATDDQRIADACGKLRVNVAMTKPDHATGTDRVAEVASQWPADVYVNVQGDEPLIDPAAIDAVVKNLAAVAVSGTQVSTAYLPSATPEQEQSLSVVHLVPTMDDHVLTFSRLPVPAGFKETPRRTVHMGLYAFTPAALTAFTAWQQGPVERAESIELLRFLEHGWRIGCVAVDAGSIGVDHPEDIQRVEQILLARKSKQ